MTGKDRGTALFLRQQYLAKVQAQGALRHPHRPVVELAQALSDASLSWERVKRVADGAAAGLAAVVGARAWLGLRMATVVRQLGAVKAVTGGLARRAGKAAKPAWVVATSSLGGGFGATVAERAMAVLEGSQQPNMILPLRDPVLATASSQQGDRSSSSSTRPGVSSRHWSAGYSTRGDAASWFPGSDEGGLQPHEWALGYHQHQWSASPNYEGRLATGRAPQQSRVQSILLPHAPSPVAVSVQRQQIQAFQSRWPPGGADSFAISPRGLAPRLRQLNVPRAAAPCWAMR